MKKREVPGIHRYDAPAGGWGALWATAKAIAEQMHDAEAPLLLWRTNKPDGFDCPGCAWPDKKHTSNFQFCENGAKAVTWEATTKRAPPELFASHTVTELLKQSDYELENHGRLTGDATRSVQNCTLTRTGNEIMKLGDFTNVRLGMDWQDDGLPRLFAFRTLF